MAKKEKLRSKELNLDSEIDFDNFDFNTIDGKVDPEVHKNTRNPVINAFKGTISGAKSHLTSPSVLMKVMRGALPREYGETIDKSKDITGEIGTLYNDAVKEIKPVVRRVTKQVDRLIPEDFKRTKGYLEKIKNLLGDDSREDRRSTESKQEGEMQRQLYEMFALQAEETSKESSRDRTENLIRDNVEGKRFAGTYGLLNSINIGMTRLSQYNDKITSAYQRKSLELQYRSYFIQSDQLETTKKFFEIFKNQNDAIAKNTGLPDYAKLLTKERIAEIAKNKLISNAHTAIFGDGEFMKRIVTGLRKEIKEKVGNIKDAFEAGSMGLEMVEMHQDTKKMLSELGPLGDENPEDTNAHQVGKMAGDWGASKLANKGGKLLKKHFIDPNPNIAKYGYKGAELFNNLPGLVEALRDSDALKTKGKGDDTDSTLTKVADKGKGIAKSALEWMMKTGSKIDTNLEAGGGIKGLTGATSFDQATRQSIVSIIPGYLARIYRELQITRTGNDKIELTEFDNTKGVFNNKSDLVKNTKKFLQAGLQANGFNDKLNAAYTEVTKGAKLSPKAEKALKAKLRNVSMTHGLKNSTIFSKPDFYTRMDAETADEIRQVVSQNYNLADADISKKDFDLSASIKNVGNSIGDMNKDVDALKAAGYVDALVELGVIKKDEAGQFSTNLEGYSKLLEPEEEPVSKTSPLSPKKKRTLVTRDKKEKVPTVHKVLAKSDIDAKEGIRSFNPKDALKGIKDTKLFKWFYKPGQGDDKEHIGPMAQDVNKNLGEDTAPGGTKLDLVSMNGANMAAISALSDEQQKMKAGSDNNIIANIKKDTSTIVDLLTSMNKLNLKVFKGLDLSGIGDSVSDKFSKFKDSASEQFSNVREFVSDKVRDRGYGGKVRDLASSAGELLISTIEKVSSGLGTGAKNIKDRLIDPTIKTGKELYAKHKDGILSTAKNLFDSGFKLVGTVYNKARDVVSDVISNKLPAGFKQLSAALSAGKEGLFKLIDRPVDIYVKGMTTPAIRAILMKAGAYFDQTTGKVINRPGEIKGPVVDKDGLMVLSVEDIEKGIVDQEGNEIQTPLMKMASTVIGFGMQGLERAKDFLSFAKEKGSKALGSMKDMFSGFKLPGFGYGKKTNELLEQIRDMLNDRLPGEKQNFGSATKSGIGTLAAAAVSNTKPETSDQKPDEAQPNQEAEPKYKSSGNVVDSLMKAGTSAFGFLKGKYNKAKGKVIDKAAEHGITDEASLKEKSLEKAQSIKEKLTEKKNSLVEKGKAKLADLKEAKDKGGMSGILAALSGKKQAFNDRDGSGRRDGSWEDQMDAQKAKQAERAEKNQPAEVDNEARYQSDDNIIDVMANKGKSLYDRFLGGDDTEEFDYPDGRRGRRRIKRVKGPKGKGGLLRRGARLVGRGFGAARDGLSTVGRGVQTVGRTGLNAAKVLPGAARVAGAASRLGTIASVARTGLMAGGLLMGGTGGAIAGTLGAAATAVGSAISLPVLLGAGAVALAGYGAYKGFQYFTRNKASLLTDVRLRQYGLTADNKDQYHYIFELESFLEKEAIGYENGQAKILERKADPEKILDIFSIDKEDQDQVNNFLQWFNGRFKPVFLTHLTALLAIDNKIKIANIDDLKPEQKTKYLGSIGCESAYGISTSPFKDVKSLTAGSSDVQKAIEAAKADIGDTKDGKDKKSLAAAELANSKDKSTEPNKGIVGKILDVGKMNPMLLIPAIALAGVTKLTISAASSISRTLGYSVTALEAVRFKAYGLKETQANAVSTLRNLESYLVKFTKTGSDNIARFEGDVADVIKSEGGNFGISGVNDPRAKEWISWFRERFLPVYLMYIGTGYQLTNKTNPVDIESSLKPGQKNDLAIKLIGVPDIWTKTASPWLNYTLNNDSKVTDENMQFLKDQAKAEVLNEEKIKKEFSKTPSPVVPPPKVDLPKVSTAGAGRGSAQVPDTAAEGETAKGVGETTGQKQEANDASVVPKKVPLFEGPLVSGEGASQYLKYGSNVDITKLNATLYKNFTGMVEEYGKLTGKVTTVNSAARSKEQQAELYRQNPKMAAKPGRSLHEFGLALDVDSATLDAMDKAGLMRKYGFTRPVGGEPWHTEPAGIQTDLNKAKADPNFATSRIAASIGRGGSGYGAIPGSDKGKRNSIMALNLIKEGLSEKATADISDKEAIGQILSPALSNTQVATPDNQTQDVTIKTASSQDAPLGGVVAKPKETATMAQSLDAGNKFSKNDQLAETEPGSYGAGAKVSNPEAGSGKEGIKKTIAESAKAAGMDPSLMQAFAAVESNFNPNAKASTSSATGLFQFTNGTWKETLGKYGSKHGLDPNASPNDPKAASLMASEYLKTNFKYIKKVKPDPGPTEAYMTHFLGAGGASQMLQADPGANSGQVLPKAAAANPGIFGQGGTKTVGQVYDEISNRIKSKASANGINIKTGSLTSSDSKSTAGADDPSAGTSGVTTPTAKKETALVPDSATSTVSQTTTSASGDNRGNASATDYQTPATQMPGRTGLTTARKDIPGMPVQSLQTPKEQGAGFSTGSTDKVLSSVDKTLTDSLSVQKQLLDAVTEFFGKMNPDSLGEITKGLKEAISNISIPTSTPTASTAGAGRGSAQASNPAVSLKRGSV